MARFRVYIRQGLRKTHTLWGNTEAVNAAHAREIGALTFNFGKPRWTWLDPIYVRVDEIEE